MLSGEPGLADGIRALPLIVLVFLLLDVVTTLIAQAYGLRGLGTAGLLPAAQSFLVAAAAAATMYNRPRTAIALTAVVVTLVFTVGTSGVEVWLQVIVGVTAAARATRGQLGLVLAAQVGYAVGLGLLAERTRPGWGWTAGLTTLGLAVAALAIGLVARRLLTERDRRRLRVRELECEQGEIRTIERARLADELQAVVAQGLASMSYELDRPRGSSDPGCLRAVLVQVDRHSRTLLTQLRALLDVLRRSPGPIPDPGLDSGPGPGPGSVVNGPKVAVQRWLHLAGARHVRLAATAVAGLVAARAALGSFGSAADAEVWVQVLGLLACAVALWRPAVAAGCAAAALVLSTVLQTSGYWDALSTTLLCLMAALRFGPRKIIFVVLAMAGYSGLLAATDSPDPRSHVVLICYLGFLGIAIGSTARHFVAAREDSLRQLVDLSDEHERVESEERSAVARELHDLVAHSLSVITMQVMATSLSNDQRTLADTVDKVRRSTVAAHHELATLLYAMRGPDGDQPRPAPLVTPLASARALAQQLCDSGYQPVLDIDTAADALDPTTQRTLGRIMQEAATNILRYTPAGSTCHFSVKLDGTGVRLRIVSPLAASKRSSDLSLGWGLRGVRERVELTSGTFSAGPEDGQWLLEVSLPAPAAALTPLIGAPEPAPRVPLPGVL